MEQLKAALTQLNIPADDTVIEKFQQYRIRLLEWNKMVNMTAVTDPTDFVKKHYVDSLLCVESEAFQKAKRVVDVGTGGGFPGVPLAIVAPEKEFVLMDSLLKRLKIVETLCREIGITNVRIVHGRAETLGRDREYREQFDLCVSRAVADTAILSEYCLPLVKSGGYFLAYKGSAIEEELERSTRAIFLLGGQVETIKAPQLDGFDLDHQLLFVKKKRPTPLKYPRKAGTPSKTPLK